MKSKALENIVRTLIVVIFAAACSMSSSHKTKFFEEHQGDIPSSEQKLFSRALELQKKNQTPSAIKLWSKFLKNNPRSFEGHNNLGLAYYANDQLFPAIFEFETALALEPQQYKIKKNLIRTLKFQAVLLSENRDYHAAIDHWKMIYEVSKPKHQEKIGLRIEKLQDRIFRQVKRVDNLEEYENFLERYPDSPINSDEARERVADLKTQQPEFLPTMDEDKAGEGSPPSEEIITEDMAEEIPQGVEPIQSERVETVTQPEPVKAEIPLPTSPKAPEPLFEKAEVLPEPSVKKVRVVTKSTSLNVREGPSPEFRVVASVPKNALVPMLEEKEGWLLVEYETGKTGWVSKNYTQVVK